MRCFFWVNHLFLLLRCHHISIQPSAEMLPGMSWSLKCGVHGVCLDSQTLSGQLLCIVSVLINLCQRANKAAPLVVSRYGNLLRVRRETEQRAEFNATYLSNRM